MQEQLLGYLVGALDADEHRQIEESLKTSPDLQRVLDQLRARLEPLSWDAGHLEPPENLAYRTCRRIERHRAILPIGEFAGRNSRWSMQDMCVAAGILIAASMLFFPALGHSRSVARIAQCQNNLRQIASALFQYSDANNGYAPFVEPAGKLATSSAFAPRLVTAGMLPDARVLFCPNSRREETPARIPTCAEIEKSEGTQLAKHHAQMGGDYRSTLGYVSDDGAYHPTRNQRRPYFAYLSDAPHQGSDHQSLNHGRCGQNVLFEDGHVQFLKTCRCTPAGHPDDIFVNAKGEIGPGMSPDDSVIVPGQFQLPDGIHFSPAQD